MNAKILVVEDEEPVRSFLQDMLANDGYHITAVATGEDALIQAGRETFDLALIDIYLPCMTGVELMGELRQQTPETDVIMLTGHVSLETVVEALRQGAYDYLFKPCQPAELRQSVARCLQKRQQVQAQRDLLVRLEKKLDAIVKEVVAAAFEQLAESSAITSPTIQEPRFLQRGDLIIDLVRRVVTLNGQLLELTPTEFSLLAYLVQESPRVVAPDELAQAVQGGEMWGAAETIRQHIYRLRRKIEAATGEANIIQNVRGVGYTLTV